MTIEQEPWRKEAIAALVTEGINDPLELIKRWNRITCDLDFLCENLTFAEKTLKATFTATCHRIPDSDRRLAGLMNLMDLVAAKNSACRSLSEIFEIEKGAFEIAVQVLKAMQQNGPNGKEAVQLYSKGREEEIVEHRDNKVKSVLDSILEKS